ncbi:MAG: hypothetical protein JRF36_13095 [Deltaproteobacteria bacterium]|nr:hypothetical protein [Deltaproteobacteria bacterium]MBW2486568.1 hypothetical protein [Deltaproteobacteria bacterium]
MTPKARKNKRLVGLFLLGSVVFNYPLLSLFNLKTSIFGVPLLILYIFSAWVILILLAAMATRTGGKPRSKSIDKTGP